jgi:hypothetical protein
MMPHPNATVCALCMRSWLCIFVVHVVLYINLAPCTFDIFFQRSDFVVVATRKIASSLPVSATNNNNNNLGDGSGETGVHTLQALQGRRKRQSEAERLFAGTGFTSAAEGYHLRYV